MGKDKRKTKGRAAALEEVLSLRAKRRADIIKIAFAIMAVIVIMVVGPMLQLSGVIESGNMVLSGATFLTAVLLAGFAGISSTDYSKCSRRITELVNLYGFTKEEMKARER